MLSDKGIRLITVVTYWIAILLGPLVPWASLILTDVAVRHYPSLRRCTTFEHTSLLRDTISSSSAC